MGKCSFGVKNRIENRKEVPIFKVLQLPDFWPSWFWTEVNLAVFPLCRWWWWQSGFYQYYFKVIYWLLLIFPSNGQVDHSLSPGSSSDDDDDDLFVNTNRPQFEEYEESESEEDCWQKECRYENAQTILSSGFLHLLHT